MKRRATIYFVLFAISGFSGLIYESIWTHYLKLFLGHAAYAQTLVLAIFMGGMAIGSALCSACSMRWRNLLAGYAIAEGTIGLCALVFHPLFDGTVNFAYITVIPRLGSPLTITLFKWLLSALLILPQSVLLGMTFPLMSAAFLRMFPERIGRSVSMLYFTNSIGASVGVLASGFFLIRTVGLPSTIRIAGLINITLALLVLWLVRRDAPVAGVSAGLSRETDSSAPPAADYRLFLAVSLATGMASFIYEIGWIRMLSLVLGTSTHAFELMLSAFILGLACGGLWIRWRIDRIAVPVRYLAAVQIIMGLLALATLPVYGSTFTIMQWLLRHLQSTSGGYLLFNLASHSIASAVMLPATFCAGMTLPLITFILIRAGSGEKSIGAVYAANTVGAIIGVFFAIHVGLPLLGLKGLVACGAGLDITLGLVLVWRGAAGYTRRQKIGWLAGGVGAMLATLFFVQLDSYKMASGVYRKGLLINPDLEKLLYYRDGKTATVSALLHSKGDISIRTNGKSDSSINMLPHGVSNPDEATMTLIGTIPLAYHPGARLAANIGFGTGLTSHTLLSTPQLQELDTIEIESQMLEAAKIYGERTELVYRDPRSKIFIDDAKSFFSGHGRKYDIIVSEPSNPWVSGVAGLFSQEFYRLVKRSMRDDGIFVQWLQLYEIDLNLVVSVLKAVSDNFSDYAIYFANDNDVLIVARPHGTLGRPGTTPWQSPALHKLLERVNVLGLQDLEIRRLGTKQLIDPLLASFPIRANSDYYPVLDQGAAKARFMQVNAHEFLSLVNQPLPFIQMLDPGGEPDGPARVTPARHFSRSQRMATALILRDCLIRGTPPRDGDQLRPEQLRIVQLLRKVLYENQPVSAAARTLLLFNMSLWIVADLPPDDLDQYWQAIMNSPGGGALSPTDRDYLTFFRALGSRNAGVTADYARRLLERDRYITDDRRAYLLAAGMLGSLAQGDRQGALQLWQGYRRVVFGGKKPTILFRLLVAQASAR